jgi:two-component system invasion response regulator UvrY
MVQGSGIPSAGRPPKGTARRRRAVRVLAVDDQEVFRRAARTLIAATPGFEQVGEACSGAEALELAAELHPDLVLLDVRMPGMDGLETARRLAGAEPDAVVVLTSLDELPERAAGEEPPLYIRKQELSTRRLREVWAGQVSARRAPKSARGR